MGRDEGRNGLLVSKLLFKTHEITPTEISLGYSKSRIETKDPYLSIAGPDIQFRY